MELKSTTLNMISADPSSGFESEAMCCFASERHMHYGDHRSSSYDVHRKSGKIIRTTFGGLLYHCAQEAQTEGLENASIYNRGIHTSSSSRPLLSTVMT